MSENAAASIAPVNVADILGCWKLARCLEARDGVVRDNPNFGENPTGFLHYLAGGRVAVTVAFGGREPMTGSDRLNAPIEELAQSARTFDAYAGRFSLLAPDTIAHHIEVSTFQNYVGTDLVRRIVVQVNILTLHPPVFDDKGVTVARWIEWRRLA